MKNLFLIIGTLVILFACGNRNENKTSEQGTDVDLMIGENITKEDFTLSWELMQNGQEMANSGESLEEIIKTFPEGTMFQTNESSILFFIEGSSALLIELRNEGVPVTEDTGSPIINQQRIQIPQIIPKFLSSTMISESESVDVVASDKGENTRENKKAMIVSPYYEEWGSTDDGPVAKKILGKNRNYKERIDYISNDITLDHFKNLASYDIVHISTHGKNYCGNIEIIKDGGFNPLYNDESETCRTLLSSGVKHGFKNAQEAFEFVENSEYKGLVVLNTTRFWLRSNFFKHFYGGGLKNKIWYFAACEMGLSGKGDSQSDSDMASTMNSIHEDGHFFYWSNIVYGKDAMNVAKLFYTNLINNGLDAKKAFEKIPVTSRSNLRSHRIVYKDSIKIKRDRGVTTSLLHKQTGNPRHGIEIIEMQHPEENRILKEGDLYPVVGDFGDGNKEALTLDVKLIGYTRAEFEEKGMRLSLKVDDKTVLNKKSFLPDVENDDVEVRSIPDNEYGVRVRIKDIEIPDLGDKIEITLKAYVYFDDKRFSIHKEKVKLKAEGILAEISDGRETSYFYYDDENKAMRAESNDSPNDSYFDEDGYIYFYNEEGNEMIPHGWVKSNSMKSMFMGNYSFKPVVGDEHINDGTEKFQFPVIAWAINYRVKHFEENQNFEKQNVDCGLPKKCTKFMGVAGEEAGHYVIFNAGGKLIEMGQGNTIIKYTYGLYGVQLPDAQEFSMPFNFN